MVRPALQDQVRDKVVAEQVTVWTDGSIYMRHPIKPGGYGYVVVVRGEEVARGSEAEVFTTVNRMELMGVITGLEAARSHVTTGWPIFVYTDSQYVARGASEWVDGWERKGWTTATGAEVKNVDLWLRVLDFKRRVPVSWHWVRGHSGLPWNELADELAGQASRGAMDAWERSRPGD